MYVDGHADIFDMINIDMFSVVALNVIVVQLDEGLYDLACEKDVHCLATLVRNFKLIEVYIEHGATAVNSYQRPPPHVRAIIEDITKTGSSATIEHKSKKMLLLTWHDYSAPTKESVCDFVTLRSLPQHDTITSCKDSVCEFVTPRYMPHGMLTSPTDESVITYTQLSGVHGVDTQDHVVPTIQSQFSDINLSFASQQATTSTGIDSSGLNHDKSFGVEDLDLNVSQTETHIELPMFEVPVFEESDVGRTQEHTIEQVIVEDYVSSEEDAKQGNGQEDESDPSTNDDDDEDDVFLVDEENEIVKPDVDVHLFGISMDVPFDNIGVTNLVPDDVLK
ncbi:hypothetical protein Tco_1085300 [Tanacetum coccineum]